MAHRKINLFDRHPTRHVICLSQIRKLMHSPRTPHFDVVNRILSYLKGTPGKGIWMKRNNTNTICGGKF
jgi:hypothetical protein